MVALCDRDAKWLQHIKQELGTKWAFETHEELLACDEVEAVSVCLPTVFHAPVTVAALRAGKHVLCEKPMAPTLRAAQQMADAARESGRILMIGFNQRFGADIQFLKRHIEQGRLGEVYFVHTAWRRPMGVLPPPTVDRATGAYDRNWFNERARGGGATLDLGSHVVDLAMYLMGFPELTAVSGRVWTKFGPAFVARQGVTFDADDHAVGFAKFAGGAAMQIEASYGSYYEREQVFQVIYGDEGGAYREAGAPVKLFTRAKGEYQTVQPEINLPTTTPMDHFVECILKGKTPIVTPEQGVAVTAILEGIYQSSRRDERRTRASR